MEKVTGRPQNLATESDLSLGGKLESPAYPGCIKAFIEIDPSITEENDEIYHHADGDFLIHIPMELRDSIRGNTPGIKLPNGNLMFYCMLYSDKYNVLQNHPFLKNSVKGHSWNEMWTRPYEFRDSIFNVMVAREMEVEGDRYAGQVSIPLAELQSGEIPNEMIARPPGIFAGEEAEEFQLEITDLKSGVANHSERPNVEMLRQEMHARLDRLEELVRSRMPTHGGIGHNQPPERIDELPSGIIVDELLEAIADARREGTAITPDLRKSDQIARRFRQWAAAFGQWTADRANAQVDNVVAGLIAGTTILWAHEIIAALTAAAKAVSDWVSALPPAF